MHFRGGNAIPWSSAEGMQCALCISCRPSEEREGKIEHRSFLLCYGSMAVYVNLNSFIQLSKCWTVFLAVRTFPLSVSPLVTITYTGRCERFLSYLHPAIAAYTFMLPIPEGCVKCIFICWSFITPAAASFRLIFCICYSGSFSLALIRPEWFPTATMY